MQPQDTLHLWNLKVDFRVQKIQSFYLALPQSKPFQSLTFCFSETILILSSHNAFVPQVASSLNVFRPKLFMHLSFPALVLRVTNAASSLTILGEEYTPTL